MHDFSTHIIETPKGPIVLGTPTPLTPRQLAQMNTWELECQWAGHVHYISHMDDIDERREQLQCADAVIGELERRGEHDAVAGIFHEIRGPGGLGSALNRRGQGVYRVGVPNPHRNFKLKP